MKTFGETVRTAAGAAKLLQSCPTLCDPIDGSPPGSPVPGVLQARTLEWVAISFFNAGKWKVKVKSLSHVWLLATPWAAAYQTPPSMGFSRQEYLSGLPLPSPQYCLWIPLISLWFPGGLWWWRICLQCRRSGFDPRVMRIPWRRKWQHTLVFLPGELHGQRRLVGSMGSQRVGHDWSANTCKTLMVENRVGVQYLSINCWASYSISNILQFRSSAHCFGEWLGSGLNAMNPNLRGCILSGALTVIHRLTVIIISS